MIGESRQHGEIPCLMPGELQIILSDLDSIITVEYPPNLPYSPASAAHVLLGGFLLRKIIYLLIIHTWLGEILYHAHLNDLVC